MSYEDMDALAIGPADPYLSAGGPSGAPRPPPRSEAKEQRRRKRRMQLAAALVEADNDEIQRRVAFLASMDPKAKDRPTQVSLVPKYANQSVLFHEALAGYTQQTRPVYVHAPQSMRELTRSYLGMGAQWIGDDSQEMHMIDDSTAQRGDMASVESVAQNLLQLQLSPKQLGSPFVAWQPPEPQPPQEAPPEAPELERSALRSSSSMPSLTEAAKEQRDDVPDVSMDTTQASAQDLTRSALMLQRIRKSRVISESKSVGDADLSEDMDEPPAEPAEASQVLEEPSVDAEPEPLQLVEPTPDLLGFRARVLKPRTERRRSSRRHSLVVSGWPEESALAESALETPTPEAPAPEPSVPQESHSDMTTRQLQRLLQGKGDADSQHGTSDAGHSANSAPLENLAPMLARRETARANDLTSAKWTKRKSGLRALFPFERRKPPKTRANESTDKPMIQLDTGDESIGAPQWRGMIEDSPVMERPRGSSAVQFASTAQTYGDEDLIGVSLKTPVVDNDRPDEAWAQPEAPPAHDASYEPAPVEPAGPPTKGLTYICIPAPLEYTPREFPATPFYVPHGAFYVDDRGVVLPRNKTQDEAHFELDFGPVQVPEGIGRRVLYPTTALFRNALVSRDDDHEGWGFERYTNALAYFKPSLYADDDDSDDEVPLMDVRIQTREEHLARRRVHRERVRRKRAHLERRRLRELAKRQGKRASVFGIEEESSEYESDSASTDWSGFSSDETDPEEPWKDDRRPAGKLYGKSLMGLAGEQDVQRRNKVRFYGQVNPDRHSAPPEGLGGFHNDTRERMAKVFGPHPRWMTDLARREEKNQQEQYDALKVGGTPQLDAQETTDLLMEPGVQEGIIYPSVHDAEEAEALAAEAADDAAVAAWQDSSDDDLPKEKPRFDKSRPRWEAREEDDVPLNRLRRRSTAADANSLAGESDDEQPLGNRHRQAAIIAENQALIKQLLEENRQVRMSLQMLTSMPYAAGMPFAPPWMPPTRSSGGFGPMLHIDEDVPLLDMDNVQDIGMVDPAMLHGPMQGMPESFEKGVPIYEQQPDEHAGGLEGAEMQAPSPATQALPTWDSTNVQPEVFEWLAASEAAHPDAAVQGPRFEEVAEDQAAPQEAEEAPHEAQEDTHAPEPAQGEAADAAPKEEHESLTEAEREYDAAYAAAEQEAAEEAQAEAEQARQEAEAAAAQYAAEHDYAHDPVYASHNAWDSEGWDAAQQESYMDHGMPGYDAYEHGYEPAYEQYNAYGQGDAYAHGYAHAEGAYDGEYDVHAYSAWDHGYGPEHFDPAQGYGQDPAQAYAEHDRAQGYDHAHYDQGYAHEHAYGGDGYAHEHAYDQGYANEPTYDQGYANEHAYDDQGHAQGQGYDHEHAYDHGYTHQDAYDHGYAQDPVDDQYAPDQPEAHPSDHPSHHETADLLELYSDEAP